jgi:hypothetical protein
LREANDLVRCELALQKKDILSAQAKANQGSRTDILLNSAKSEPADTRATLAKQAGVSGDTIHKAEKIKAPEGYTQ